MRKQRHSDDDVKFWAEVFTELDITLEEIESELKIPHSTTSWCFIHRLPHIDYDLYERTMNMINTHIHTYKSRKEDKTK